MLADLAVEMGKLCFDGNLTYTEFNSTMAFEEGLVDGDTYIAGPISRGANTCVTWPTNQYFIPVLQSNGKSDDVFSLYHVRTRVLHDNIPRLSQLLKHLLNIAIILDTCGRSLAVISAKCYSDQTDVIGDC